MKFVLNPDEIIWCAGFWDGEGCCYLQKTSRGHRRLRMSITQKDIRPLQRFQRAMNMGKIYGPRPQPPHTHYLYFNRQESLKLIELLLPHLCEPKVEQIERCMMEEVRYAPNGQGPKAGIATS